MRNDPKVIAAYLGVEDEEVERSKRRSGCERAGRRAPLLAVRGVKTFYGNIMALKGVDIDVHEGEIVTLIGANGAGKSTLMMTIFGDAARPRGPIIFDGRDITRSADPRDRAAAHRPVARGPAHLPAHDGAREPADGRRDRRAAHFDEDLERVFALFPAPEASGATSAAARCRAASSRCWRSPAR